MENRNVLNYTLLRLLGRGGMAEVWYAENRIEKPAAVKVEPVSLGTQLHPRTGHRASRHQAGQYLH